MAEQIKFGDRLFLAGEKVVLDFKDNSPILEARNGELVIGYNTQSIQEEDHHVIIKGNLTVEGTMTSLQTENTIIQDNTILLNEGEVGPGITRETQSGQKASGIEIDRGPQSETPNTFFVFDEEGWLGTGGIDPAIDVVVSSSWTIDNESRLSLDEDLSARHVYARNSLKVGSYGLHVVGDADIDGDTNIGGDNNITGNVNVTESITSSNPNVVHQIGNFTFNASVMDVTSGETEIHSPANILLYPQDNILINQGTKLSFEGTSPDDFQAKLQATSVTEDRDIILPDESGTLALQEWVKRELNYVQFQSIVGDGILTDYTMTFTVAEDWQVLIYIDGVAQEPGSSYTITNGDQLSFAEPIPNGSTANLIRLANNSHTSTISSAQDTQTLNSQSGSYYLDYNNFSNVPTNVSTFVNDAGYLTSETDSQTLSYNNGVISISNGNSININDINTGLASEQFVINAISNIPTPTGSGYPNFVSSQNLSHGSAVGGTTVTATIPSGATIAYIPWTTVNSARNSGPFNVIVNGTSYFVDDMATGGDSGSTSGLLEIGLLTGTIILGGVVTAMLGTPVTSLQLYSQHNDSDSGSASVGATVYYDA